MSTAAESLRATEPGTAERWLPVPGFEGRYEVSDQGRVWSCFTNRILRPGPTSRGYLSVHLYYGDRPKHGKSCCVHDLVMAAFVGPKPKGFQVDHGRRGKQCNALTNLEYVTPLVNIRRAMSTGKQRRYSGANHINAKLAPRQVRMIRKVWPKKVRGTIAALARRFKVSPEVIIAAGQGRSYRNVT